jgi:TPR repeat protein
MRKFPEGVKYFRMAAEQGYSDAQGILAMAYRDGGKDFTPDPIQAFTWFSVLVMNNNDENNNDEHMQWQEQKRMVAKDLSQEQLVAAEEKAAQLFRQHGSGKWFDE